MTTNNNNSIPTVQTKGNFVSPIKFSEIIGKKPQQVYTWLRTNSIPKECIQEDMFSDKKLLILDKTLEWYNNKPSRSSGNNNPVTMLTQDPSQMLEMMIGWFKQAGQISLADDLDEVLYSMRNPIPIDKE